MIESDDKEDRMVIDTSSRELVWQESLMPLINSVKSILPDTAWTKMSPHFYVTFWQLKLYDIYVPRARYLSEIAKQKGVSVSRDLNSRGSTAEEIGNRIKEKRDAGVLIVGLEKEMKVQEKHVKEVAKRLDKEKDSWFANCMCSSD
jgi:THO complex subunit 2